MNSIRHQTYMQLPEGTKRTFIDFVRKILYIIESVHTSLAETVCALKSACGPGAATYRDSEATASLA